MSVRVKSFCRNCTGSCGLEFEVEDNRILAVQGDRDHPISGGYHCIKAPMSVDLLNGRYPRLLQSQQRSASGEFMPIAADRALDAIAARLQTLIATHGPRSVGLFYGTGAYFNGLGWPLMKAFVSELGSPNLFSTMTIDQSARWVSILRMGTLASGTPAPADVETLLIVGKNPLISHQLMGFYRPGKALRDFRDRGGKMILVDPRATETSRHADLHLALKPGTDVALFAGLIRLILARNWHDAAFCQRFADGLDALRTEVEPYTPALVEAHCGIAPAQLLACAELFAQRRSLAVVGTGPCMGPHSNLAVHLIDALNVICGNFLRAGAPKRVASLLFPRTPVATVVPPNRTWERGVQCHSAPTGALFGELPSAALPDEILTPGPDRIRALIVLGGNPVTALGQPDKTLRAFADLELLVVIDPRMTETARMAHYVIAPTLQYERHDLTTVVDGGAGFSASFVQYTPPVVTPPPGTLHESDFFWGLAQRLGLQLTYKKMILGMDYRTTPGGHAVDMQTPPDGAQLARWWCEGTALDFAGLAAAPSGVLGQDVATVQAPASDSGHRLALCPTDVAAELRAVLQEQAPAAYPFRLIGRRLLETMNSLYREAEPTRRRYPVNYAYMHPLDLQALALTDGGRVRIRSAHGELVARPRADATLPRQVIAMAHQWGDPDAGGDPGGSKGAFSGQLVSLEQDIEAINRMPRQTAIAVAVMAAD